MSFDYFDPYEDSYLVSDWEANEYGGEVEMASDILENFSNIDEGIIFEWLKDTEIVKRLLNELVNELPAYERRLIQMRFWESLPVYEISYMLGVSTSSVKRRLRHSFEYLKERLIEEVMKVEKKQASA